MLRRPLVTLVLAAALTGCALPGAEPLRPVVDGALPVPADAQDAVVVRVSDGDTVVLRGRGAGPLPAEPTRVRVLLVDTPEVHDERECFGEQASERTALLLPGGSDVRVQADEDRTDRFGRSLLHVWTRDGVNLGELLVSEGYATVLQVGRNRRYLERFEAREDEAREAGRGLWGACDAA